MKKARFLLIVALIACLNQVISQNVSTRHSTMPQKVKSTNMTQRNKNAVGTTKPRAKTNMNQHLLFMGKPNDGTLEGFTPFLIKKGFRQTEWSRMFKGAFYQVSSRVIVRTAGKNETVNSIEIRYYNKDCGLNEDQMIDLYNRITEGLKREYAHARYNQSPSGYMTLLVMPSGYISCEIYNKPLSSDNLLEGTFIDVFYVDKKNTQHHFPYPFNQEE